MANAVKVRLTGAQVVELIGAEVDTLDERYAPAGKAEFCAELARLDQRRGGTLTLSGPALAYAASSTGPFANSADCLRDQRRHAMAAAFEQRYRDLAEYR